MRCQKKRQIPTPHHADPWQSAPFIRVHLREPRDNAATPGAKQSHHGQRKTPGTDPGGCSLSYRPQDAAEAVDYVYLMSIIFLWLR